MATAKHWEQDKDSTVYIGNLDERVSDQLVWELFLQAGRIVNVHLPKDRVTQTHQGYGFVEFISEEDAEYAARIMNQIRLYGKQIRVNKASTDRGGAGGKGLEVGAELFVGGLDSMVDERTLYDTFSRFGTLVSPPKVARDEMNLSKGYGFVSYSNFEASDDAIANMHGQYLMNKEVSVQYAYKKDGKGERHGDQAERLLASQAKAHGVEIQPVAMPVGLVAPPSSAFPPVPISAGSMSNDIPNGFPPVMPMGFAPPQGPASIPVQNGYHNTPPPQMARPPPPPMTPLSAPPSGLPARPPAMNAGYGGPQNYAPPGFAPPPPQGFQGPPHMYAQPPSVGMPPPPVGFGPPANLPPGFGNYGLRK